MAVAQQLRLQEGRAVRSVAAAASVAKAAAALALLAYGPDLAASHHVPHSTPTVQADLARARIGGTTDFLLAPGRVTAAARERREADHAPR